MPRKRDRDLLRAVGLKLAALRQERSLTQAQLAEKMGIEPVTMSRLETGDLALTLTRLAIAAEALEVDLAEMVDVEAAGRRPRGTAELLRVWADLDSRDRSRLLGVARVLAKNV